MRFTLRDSTSTSTIKASNVGNLRLPIQTSRMTSPDDKNNLPDFAVTDGSDGESVSGSDLQPQGVRLDNDMLLIDPMNVGTNS